MQIIIPLSGVGQRFINAGYTVPKPLIEVDGMPIIQHVVNLFPGETNITFICNDKHLRETNMREILNNISPICKIVEVSVENRQGPVHAVSQAYDIINDNEEVIISYCDYGTWWNYKDFLDKVRITNADGSIPSYIGFHPHMLGSDNYAFMQHTNMWMTKIQEKKPFTDNKMTEYASNGTYYFKTGAIMKKYFNELMNRKIHTNGEYYVSMVYNLLLEDKHDVLIYEIDNMLQWGTPYDLEVYNMWSAYFKQKMVLMESFNDSKQTHTILPMAGKGSRFGMIGYTTAKPFLEVEGLPMIIQAINSLPNTTALSIVTLEDHFNKYTTEFKILQDTYPIANITKISNVTDGQATTCSIIADSIDDDIPILISACDNGAYYNMEAYEKLVNDDSIDVIVWSFTNNPTSKLYPHMYAWLDVDENDFIQHVSVKKPLVDKANIHAIIGTMLFKKSKIFKDGYQYIRENNIQTNGEYYVDDVLNPLIKMGYNVKVFPVDYYLCWGTPNDYKTYLYWEDFFNKCDWHPYERLLI
jgi:dTDP-glucose pyrophosphorylase